MQPHGALTGPDEQGSRQVGYKRGQLPRLPGREGAQNWLLVTLFVTGRGPFQMIFPRGPAKAVRGPTNTLGTERNGTTRHQFHVVLAGKTSAERANKEGKHVEYTMCTQQHELRRPSASRNINSVALPHLQLLQ